MARIKKLQWNVFSEEVLITRVKELNLAYGVASWYIHDPIYSARLNGKEIGRASTAEHGMEICQKDFENRVIQWIES